MRVSHGVHSYSRLQSVPSVFENASWAQALHVPLSSGPQPAKNCPTLQASRNPQGVHSVRGAEVSAYVCRGQGLHIPLLTPPHPCNNLPGGHRSASQPSHLDLPSPLHLISHDGSASAYLPCGQAKHSPLGKIEFACASPQP